MPADADTPYDVVVLGGGSGGYACALRAAELGLSVALVEKGKLGGTCLHNGCIPTKALLHAAEVADSAREGSRFGIKTTFESVDMSGVHAYKDGVVGRLYKGLQGLVASRSIEFVQGTGRLGGPDTVDVDGRRITGRNVVLATGSYAKSLPGLEIGGRIMTSDQALTIDHVPARVVVLGGGVIGVEFASVFRSFGSEVTIVEALPRLVAAEDEAISNQLQRAFRKREHRLPHRCPVRRSAAGGRRRDRRAGGRRHHRGGPAARRRRPRSEHGRSRLRGGRRHRRARLRPDRRAAAGPTSPTCIAVGDIVPGLQLAHRGFAQGIFVAEEIAGLSPAPVEDRGIPRVTYCDPEIASVGLTETQAREAYGEIETYEYNLGGNGKSQILQTQGFVKLVREKDGPVVGVHMIGARMGEQVGEAQLIVNWDAFPSDVAGLVHAHPTQNEALGEAHLALAGKPLHAHA